MKFLWSGTKKRTMLFNDTWLILMYTANMVANLPQKGSTHVSEHKFKTTTTIQPVQQSSDIDSSEEWYMWRCYSPYGCFYLGAPWSGGSRPVSTFPVRPERISPSYTIFTRETVDQPYLLVMDNPKSIADAPLKRDKNLYFIIHGYLDNGNKTWVMRTMREILIRENCNVVIVNWIGGAGPPYTQAVANTRLVGAMTARIAAQLIEVGKHDSMRMHCIGHSLGAHLCGYVGYNMRVQYGYTLGRISGLDPAEPHFSNTSSLVRLDPSDAKFVTAIHTDSSMFISGGLGISQPVAHIDFYPNEGRNQPGCNEGVLNSITLENGSVFRGIKRFLGCSHIRSYEYFIESVNTKCPFVAVPCSDWETFQNGSCFDCTNQYCPKLGLDVEPKYRHMSVYMMTGRSKPFCKGHYRILIKISMNEESVDHGGEVGLFSLRVIGANGKMTDRIPLSDSSQYYEPGSEHKLVIPGDLVGKPEGVELAWEYQSSVFNPLTWRFMYKPKVYVDYLTIDSLEYKTGITVCPESSKSLVANEPRTLKAEYCQNSNVNLVST